MCILYANFVYGHIDIDEGRLNLSHYAHDTRRYIPIL